MNQTRSTRPAPVRIADLVAPEYPEEIGAAFEMVAPMAEILQWSSEAILSQAAAETGLEDFGDDLHVAPLDSLMKAMPTEGDLSTLGQLSNHSTLVGYAKQKLLVADLLKRHPEIHDIEIERPVVIAGQGRTGTTHLHNLMSSDLSFRTMPYWESPGAGASAGRTGDRPWPGRRRRSPFRALRRGSCGPQRCSPILQADARYDPRACARGDCPSGHSLRRNGS